MPGQASTVRIRIVSVGMEWGHKATHTELTQPRVFGDAIAELFGK